MAETATLNVPALNELIAHLVKQPAGLFSMKYIKQFIPECGTVACIYGHAKNLWGFHSNHVVTELASKLNFKERQIVNLCMPDDWHIETLEAPRYPLSRAIATLKRLRDVYEATGQVVVDWGPEPGAEPKKDWSAPVVSGGLPASITSALDGGSVRLTAGEPVA